jgi:SPP1 gp7 family putative phage head morphogenesis protein
MCNFCLNINANQYDPTNTLMLRKSFVSAMNKRFRALRGIIRKSIDENDCFGIRDINANAAKDMNLIPSKAFKFITSRDKIEAFMEWLREQAALGILDVRTVNQLGRALEEPWTNVYIESAYKRGIERAYTEMNKAGYTVPTLASLGGIDAIFNSPVHADRVGILYTRVYSDLKGITDAMGTQISRVLAQGMIDGKNPRIIAKELTRTISGPVGDLSLTDTLGRFMPAERRAQTLARTEIIRAHHLGMIQEYRNYDVLGIQVKAEWLTAGDRRVCPDCQSLEGSIWTLDQIEGMIPAHANCRCLAIPIPI